MSGFEVSGGAGGLAGDLDAMCSAADRLAGVGADLAVVAATVGTVLVSPALLATAPVHPTGFARVQRELLPLAGGPRGLGAASAGLVGLGGRVRVAATLYREADVAATAAAARLRHEGAVVVGASLRAGLDATAPWLVVAGCAVLAVWGTYRAAPLALREAEVLVLDAASGRFRWSSLDDRWVRFVRGHGDVLLDDVDAVRHEGTLWLARHPDAAESLVGAVPGVLEGLSGPLGPAGRLLGDEEHRWWPPRDVGDVTALVAGLGAVAPAFVDGPVRVAPVAEPPPPARGQGVAGAVDRLARYASGGPAVGVPHVPDRVRVEQVSRGSGTVWSVYVPPTQDWTVRGGPVAFDGSTNVRSHGGLPNASLDAVRTALEQAEVPAGAPVMLSGYSQGGLVATQLAADESFRARYDVQAVLTLGSPVGERDLPPDVPVLSVEHEQDLTVAADGRRNPDHTGWTTVRRDLLDPVTGVDGFDASMRVDPFAAHRIEHYLDTARAVDASSDDSVVAWREAAAPFLDTDGALVVATEYEVRRVVP
ncbi:hypothetical protein [Thalassiella azotivora]